MANIKFTEFPSATVVGSMDIIPIVQDGINKKTTASVFKTYLSSNFVPYTGATTNLNLDAFDLYTAKVWLKDVPNDAFGSMELTDGVLHFEDGDGHSMVTMEDGYLTIANASTIRALLDVSALSANRDFAFPNASGTLALTSQLSSYVPTTRTVSTTSPLAGGGALSSNLTLSIPQSSGSVNGYLSSADWTTFNNKQNALTNPITGTGTTNYLPKFTGASALGNSLIYDSGTNIGIGITTPSERLEVQNAAAGAKIKVSNSGGGFATLECSSNATSVAQLSFTNQLTLSGGNVILSNGLTAADLIQTSYGTARIQVTSTTNSANSALRFGAKNSSGTTKNAGLYYISGATSADTFMSFAADDTNYQFNFLANGNCLIGTTTDAGYKLDVNGTARVQSDATINSLTIGRGGSNVSSNTASGFEALLSNTTGTDNTSLGWKSLRNNTTGGGNVAIGSNQQSGNFTGVSMIGVADTGTGNNQMRFGSSVIPNGAVATEVNASTKVWNVFINGVAYKILLA